MRIDEITRRNFIKDFIKGAGAAAVAGSLGGKVDIAKAALDINTLESGDQYWYVIVKDNDTGQGGKYVFSIDTFKDREDATNTISEFFKERGHENIRVSAVVKVRR